MLKIFLPVSFSLAHPVEVSNHLRFRFSRKPFSCKCKMASVKSVTYGSFARKARPIPLALVKPGTKKSFSLSFHLCHALLHHKKEGNLKNCLICIIQIIPLSQFTLILLEVSTFVLKSAILAFWLSVGCNWKIGDVKA